jgi:O-antigen ligase
LQTNASPTEHATRNTILYFAILIIAAIVFAASAFFAYRIITTMQTMTRGVSVVDANSTTMFGVNASLEQYNDADLTRALTLIRDGGFKSVRQHFYWNDIEPRKGEYDWTKWDRVVVRAREFKLDVIAVIDTTPEWARDPGERDLVNAAPVNPDDYARFVSAFVKHYGDSVRYVQIWDNPNVHPFWGRRNADPIEYTVLLKASATAARAVNPNVKIILAGLAPSNELIREHPDYSDVLFLRGIYESGGQNYFDITAAKPYGMWSGPDDRRVAMDTFNFSRAILLRDEMVMRGDSAKPMWAVEFGWNALSKDWSGAPSPWGTDTEEVQSQRLADAVQRARTEWGWMQGLVVSSFQPNVPSNDPQWGFSLVDKNFQPRALYSAFTRAIASPVQPVAFNYTQFYLMLAGLLVGGLVAAIAGALAFWRLPFEQVWQAIESRFIVLPEIVQFAVLAIFAIAFYYSPNAVINFALLGILIILFALRLDLGLFITIFTTPFYLLPKNLIGGSQFSMVELLLIGSIVAWALVQVKNQKIKAKSESRTTHYGLRITHYLSSLDYAIIFFALVGLLSVAIAANFGVAMREFRVIVIEPALFYGLIRASNLSRRDVWRLADAFILSAVAISLIGLYQFFFTNWVIIGEGVRRVLAVYGSPNNLALYLDRALPLAIALALFGDESTLTPFPPLRSASGAIVSLKGRGRQIFYILAIIAMALVLYLTYSRGSWVGIAAGFVVIALLSGRRVRIGMIAMFVVAAIAVIPFLGTERAQSLFQSGTGTGFFRVSVWQSGWNMILDHPIFGVGLDNFLYEYPKYIQPDAWREPNLSHPHNIVLDFWARMGILGVVALGWMLFEFIRKATPTLTLPRQTGQGTNRALVIGLMASMAAALAHGMIDAAYFYVDLAFVWMLTLAVIRQLGDS